MSEQRRVVWNIGNGDPTDDVGHDGELYLDLDTNTIWGMKDSDTWSGTNDRSMVSIAQADTIDAVQGFGSSSANTEAIPTNFKKRTLVDVNGLSVTVLTLD